jgi:hypothetical protein
VAKRYRVTVTGRRSGQPRSTPVVPVQTDRGRWLAATEVEAQEAVFELHPLPR